MENFYHSENPAFDVFFPGNSYINYGYHEDPIDPSHIITAQERLESQAALYDYIFKILNPIPSDSLLEVGCGRGDGAVRLLEKYAVKQLKALDLLPQQIAAASKRHHSILMHNKNINFHVGSAEKIPFAANSFSKIYSVEAAQHFDSLDRFSHECSRVLQPSGKVVISTFFATSISVMDDLKKCMPDTIGTIDKIRPIEEVINAFNNTGFKCTLSQAIGKNIFPLFDQWLAQQKLQDWARLWVKLWENGILEYYVLSFEKE